MTVMFSLLRLYIVKEVSGLEILFAFLYLAVCSDFSVERLRKFPLSMTFALSKSIT